MPHALQLEAADATPIIICFNYNAHSKVQVRQPMHYCLAVFHHWYVTDDLDLWLWPTFDLGGKSTLAGISFIKEISSFIHSLCHHYQSGYQLTLKKFHPPKKGMKTQAQWKFITWRPFRLSLLSSSAFATACWNHMCSHAIQCQTFAILNLLNNTWITALNKIS